MKAEVESRYLNLEEAAQVLTSLGFGEVTREQMYRLSSAKTLPFFKHGKRLYIEYQELLNSFRKKQVEALRKCK